MGSTWLLIIGLTGLVLGGEFLVRGSVSLARALGISPMVIGLTLVGFGTSSPELVTSLQAALSGSPGIAIGNVVGSNIGNILLILGITALLGSMVVDPAAFRRDGIVLAITTFAIVCLLLLGSIHRITGMLLVSGLAGYLIYILWSERKRPSAAQPVFVGEAEIRDNKKQSVAISVTLVVLGLAITIFGARFLVNGAIDIAKTIGVSETLIGLTIVAVGTSLPELVTSIMAILRKQGDVALGNIIGSNIFNTLGILGITAIVHPLEVPSEIIKLDIWVMSGATILLLVFARTGWRLGRREGAVLFSLYVFYLSVLVRNA